jgi:hypothetical protein
MSNYVKSTNFASKDSLATGNPLKIVKGTEIDNEFNNIATAVATKADLNSPVFIGTPVAPTASAGTNNTQVATTAYADAAIINERNATATLTNKTLTSPLMTGAPTAPTAVAGTNTTQIATTAFVKTAVDNYDAALTVSTTQIEDNAVTTAKIAYAAVTASKVADSNIITSKIADLNVTSDKIASFSITAAKLADNSVTTTKVADANITNAKLADGSVTTTKLASGEQMNTTNVLSATAGASVGAVGTYAFLVPTLVTIYNAGSTLAGSNLRYANAASTDFQYTSGTPSGTWRLMGYITLYGSDPQRVSPSVWLRIS